MRNFRRHNNYGNFARVDLVTALGCWFSQGFEFKCEGFGTLDMMTRPGECRAQTQTEVFAEWVAGWQSAADVPIWGMFHRVSVLPAMQRDSSGFYLIAGAGSRLED